jgi:pimeloyl-ACP methyl ester carboxylesterase
MAKATSQLLRKDWRHKLPSITAPTLVVWGEHDHVCNPRIGERIAETVPGARLVIIRGAGHNPMWEKQAEFDREVLGFLSGQAPRLDGSQDAATATPRATRRGR